MHMIEMAPARTQLAPAGMADTPHKMRGASLIEALVALLVLALGVLGLAGIQTQTLLESRASNSRAVAVRMVEDLNERMQSNRAIRLASPQPNPHPYVFGWGSPPAITTNCLTATCTGTQTAAFDVLQWKDTLSAALPGGDAQVFQLPNDTRQFGVIVGWTETTAKGEAQATGAELGTYTATFALPTTGTNTFALPPSLGGVSCPDGRQCHLVYIRP